MPTTLALHPSYLRLATIRAFEETLLEEFGRGTLSGTTHTCIGQEANAVGVLSQIEADDLVVSNHRCHGHFLAYGGSPAALFAEVLGKPWGVCGGVGGSQHLHWRNFYSNGILGGTLPLAVGLALGEKRLGRRTVTVCFLGDGALGEGVLYESLNLASLWGAPVLFVVEHNGIAQTTPTELALAGTVEGRFTAFGIPVQSLDTSDALAIAAVAGPLLAGVRAEQRPHALVLRTIRFGPHSKGDDTRPADRIQSLRQTRCPLQILGARLAPDDRAALDAQARQTIAQALAQAHQGPSLTHIE